MSTLAAFPGLSALLAWPTEHLTEAADYWEAMGGRYYGLATQVWQDALSVDWQGAGADALRSATHADMITTSAVADQLSEAAKVARSGASDLYAARSRVRYTIEDARTSGFVVGEDLSVTDRSSGGSPTRWAARQAQAQAFSGDIRLRAAQLVGLDQQVAGKVSAAMAGIRETFPPNPSPDSPPKDHRVQAVDHHWKEDPTPPPQPVNPFAGWTEQQKQQVAVEIAHGHSLEKHPEDFSRGWAEPDLARWIYESMNDPNTRFGTNTRSGALTLLRDGKIIYINPRGGDYGTAFRPNPLPGQSWQTPLEYFAQNTRAAEPLPPPAPGRLPPLTGGKMAPPPPPAPRVPSPVERAPIEAPAPRPAPPGLGSIGGGGGGVPGLGHGSLHVPTLEAE